MSRMLSIYTATIAFTGFTILGCGESVTFQSTQVARPTKAGSQDATGLGENLPGSVSDVPGRHPTDGLLGDGQDGDGARDQITITESFNAFEEKVSEQNVAVERGRVTTSLTMQDRIMNKELEATQTERPIKTDQYVQGSPAAYTTDTRTGSQMGVLDLLVVIDSSGSMSDEQTQIKTKLPDLLSEVSAAEWRIAVVTTDPSKGNPIGMRKIIPSTNTTMGCLREVINKNDADKAAKFNAAIDAGLAGTGTEQGIRQSVEGLACLPDGSESWLRANSTVAVLIVSDEDNCSNGSCGGKDWSGATNSAWPDSELGDGSSLVTYLHSIRPLNKSAVYAIHWDPDVARAECKTGAYQGITYQKAIAATGGTEGLICAPEGQQPDFAAVLQQISRDVQQTLQADFLLSQVPTDPKSIVVKVGPNKDNLVERPASDFIVAGSTLTFVNNPPKNLDIIEIYYQSRASAMKSKFLLNAQPADGTLKVTVGGKPVDYTFGQDEDERYYVQFKDTPVEAAVIRMVYRDRAVILPKVFAVDTRIVNIETLVKRPGEDDYSKVDPANYTLEGNSVVFATPPTDGVKIKFRYKKNLGVVLSYPLTIVGETPHDFQAIDADTGDELTVGFAAGMLTFDPESAAAGRKAEISYFNADKNKMSIALSGQIVADSLNIVSEMPCALGMGATLEGSDLQLDCNFGDQPEFRLTYKTRLPRLVYTMNGLSDPDAGTWQVQNGGKRVQDFVRQGATVTLKSAPNMDSKVILIYNGPN